MIAPWIHRRTRLRPPARPGAAARTRLALAGLLLTGSGASQAEPSAAGAASCRACHGIDGEAARDGEPPRLGSLSAREIEAALTAFRTGARDGSVMPRIAKGFSASEAAAVARSLGRDDGAGR